MDLRLRAVELSDIDNIFKWENDFSLWNMGSTRTPFSRYAIEDYVKTTQNYDIYTAKQFRFMIDLIINKEVFTIGCIDLYDFEPENLKAGIGILIDNKYRNSGYGNAAIIQILNYSKNILHLNQLYAFVSKDNLVSMKLFKKSGFEETSILKEWIRRGNNFIDVIVFQKNLNN